MSWEISFTKIAENELIFLEKNNIKAALKVAKLVKDIVKNPKEGLGKLEKLKGRINTYSRRVNQKDRLVYEVKENTILILQCKSHYDDK